MTVGPKKGGVWSILAEDNGVIFGECGVIHDEEMQDNQGSVGCREGNHTEDRVDTKNTKKTTEILNSWFENVAIESWYFCPVIWQLWNRTKKLKFTGSIWGTCVI